MCIENEFDADMEFNDFEDYDGPEAFTCPECGRKFPPDEDAGNGYCRKCAPNH